MTQTTPDILDFSDPQAEYERVRAALQRWIDAHETGRFEPAQIAYEEAKKVLTDAE